MTKPLPVDTPLPRPDTTEGTPRRIGVEVEFAGLEEDRVAQVLSDRLGGTVTGGTDYHLTVKDSRIGDIGVELDTALRKGPDSPLRKEGLDLARAVIPVEIVTAPLLPGDLPHLDRALADLRDAGAEGSRGGMFYGFGVHLNPEITGADDPHTARTIRAYALVEEWLRLSGGIDGTRRLLPFVDRWPFGLIDDLTREAPDDLGAIMAIYARHTVSRNHGLDLLPLFRHHDPDRFGHLFGQGAGGMVSARPAFHFRLPDSRIDESDWSLAEPMAQWRLVEQVACDPTLLNALSEAWQAHRAAWLDTRGDWGRRAGAVLEAHSAGQERRA